MSKFCSCQRLNYYLFTCLVEIGSQLCSPSCPGTHSVDQPGLELMEIRLSLPPESWD